MIFKKQIKTKMENLLNLDTLITKTGRPFSPEVVAFARKELENSTWKDTATKMGYMITHPDYLELSGAMLIEYIKVHGPESIDHYVEVMKERLEPQVVSFMINHEPHLAALMKKYEHQDYDFNYFAASVLKGMYLARPSYDEDVFESPSYFYLRVVVGLFFDWKEGDPVPCDALGTVNKGNDMSSALQWIDQVYAEALHKRVAFATPTLFSSGFKKSQKASCFLIQIGDNLDDILLAVNKMGQISKHRGGIGFDISRVRHSDIGSIGMSAGTRTLLLLYDKLLRYADQTGVRKGRGTVYQRPQHPDILDFATIVDVDERGTQESTPNLDNAFWMNWMFFKRLKGDKGGKWTLFCPAKTPSLNDKYGVPFIKEYERLEALYEEWRGKEGILKEYIRGAKGIYKAKLEEQLITEKDPLVIEDLLKRTVGVREEEKGHYKFLLGLVKFTKQIHVDDILRKITEMQRKWGRPYILNGDACNFKSNQRNLGYISCSNLCCMAANQRIPTQKGLLTVKELYEEGTPNIVPGRQKLETASKMELPRPNAPMVRIHTKEGYTHDVTPDHPVWVTCLEAKQGERGGWVEAQNLKEGDKIEIQQIEGPWGDMERIDDASSAAMCATGGVSQVVKYGWNTFDENRVPDFIWRGNRATVKRYLQGLLHRGSFNAHQLEILSFNVNEHIISDVQILWANFGVKSYIESGKLYLSCCKTVEEIFDLAALVGPKTPQMDKTATFTHLENLDNADAYCLTVDSEEHAWVANGLVTKNTEIVEYTDPDEIACCNLGSLNLGAYVTRGAFDFDLLGKNTRMMVNVLNRVIDNNFYPVEQAKNSNLKHRPIGLGVCGWGDALNKLRLPVESEGAMLLNKKIAACIYYNSLIASSYLGFKQGNYSTFQGSPMNRGKFQFDLWQDEYRELEKEGLLNPKVRRWEDQLPLDPSEWGQKIVKFGEKKLHPLWESLRYFTKDYMRNSLLVARMPTASSASLSSATESAEIHSSNIYSRNVLSVSSPVVNKSMQLDLMELGLWNTDTIDFIRCCDGSISKLKEFIAKFPTKVPDFDGTPENIGKLEEIQEIYKTIWEISQKVFIRHAAQAGIYICQSHSFNIYLPDPSAKQLKGVMLEGADIGLKTLNYYVRSLPAAKPNANTVDPAVEAFAKEMRSAIFYTNRKKEPKSAPAFCAMEEGCVVCSS